MAGKILKMKARKPSFEVGASQPLSFGKKKEETPKVNNIVGRRTVRGTGTRQSTGTGTTVCKHSNLIPL